MLKSIEIGRKTFVIKFSRTHRGLSCSGLCRFVPVVANRDRSVSVPTGTGASRNRKKSCNESFQNLIRRAYNSLDEENISIFFPLSSIT